MSIYEIPDIVKEALPFAATPVNIMNSFKKTGIWPYNPNIFTEEDFAPSYVTDRPLISTNDSTISQSDISLNNIEIAETDMERNVSNIPLHSENTTEERQNFEQPGTSGVLIILHHLVLYKKLKKIALFLRKQYDLFQKPLLEVEKERDVSENLQF